MEFLFDHYKKIKDPTLYLHNPDMKPISAIKARNRNFVLRFNDLSELTFEAPKYEKSKDGTMFELPYYSRLATKRLIKIDEIGWFQITQAVENEDGLTAYMSITAQSHQCAFKEKGFFCEGRLYKFYDESDPYDANYDSDKEDAIPSVVGQLYQQLGIKVAVAITDFEPDEDYGDWTIVYIDPVLKYAEGATSNICRAFKENSATYGYDFMVNSVENAFEVIFDFDFMHHAIKVKRVESVTQKTNIYLSFDNVVNELQTTEKADDIVTVLNCSGNDLDIRTVNPTGTNYIVDFSYYMDEVNYHWMSQELITKIKAWKSLVDSKKVQYSTLVSNLRDAYEAHTEASSDIVYIKRKNQDLEAVRDQYIVDNTTANMLFVAEIIEVGKKSLDSSSPYHTTALVDTDQRTCYSEPPTYSDGSFSFSGSGTKATLKSSMENNKLYYMDYSGNTYCKIVMGSKVENGAEVNYVASVERYTVYSNVSTWLTIYGTAIDSKQDIIDERQATVDEVLGQMQTIADETNILKYFSDTPTLLTELRHYWIEGDYNNENLAVLDSTTQEEAIDLARELLACGEKELARVCQPRFSVSVNSIKFIKIYAFRKFMYELALGKVITVEKTKDVYYYPALTQMSFSLENGDDTFELIFSNALKLTDWGFTYADLIASASNTSKNVISNWNELMDYSAHKNSIQELLLNPLDKTLRLAEKNMNNQEFVVDNTGILGRRRKSEDLFEPEQVRMINNLLLFTDDSWQTVKTALGKIVYNEDGVDKKAYGLLAEVLVGSLIMSNKTKIVNEDSSIILDANGILIKKADGTETFKATPDGNLTVKAEITGGTINIGDKFFVDEMGDVRMSGNILLDGSITWGSEASPTRALYSSARIAKPTDGSLWSSYPATNSSGWHKTFSSEDRYGTYTYDGGNTWTDPIQVAGQDGEDGETIQVAYLYYRKSSSSAPSKPTYSGGTLPTGWTLEPQSVTASYPYVFVSQCKITDGVYGSWSTPVCWAKYGADGEDGSDASVTDINVFNALTSNGTMYGCFTSEDNKLYINAAYIKSGQIDSDLILAGNVVAGDMDVTGGTIGAFRITSDGLESEYIKLNAQSIFFPTQAIFNLANDVTIYNESTVSYIATSGNRDFEIKNIGGAGIRFKANTASETVKQTITLNNFVGSEQDEDEYVGTGYACSVTCNYSISNSGVLLVPYHVTFYLKYAIQEWTLLNGWVDKTTYETELSYDIPKGSNSGSIKFEQVHIRKNSTQKFVVKGVSIDKSSYGSSVAFSSVNISATNNILYSLGSFCPNTSATSSSGYLLGDDTHVWRSVRAYTASITTSDARQKHSVEPLSESYEEFFDGLEPVSFIYEKADSDRRHVGFIAQDVEQSLLKAGISLQDFAGVCIGSDEDKTYGLRYEEFIAINTLQIQKLKARVAELEKEIKELKGEN